MSRRSTCPVASACRRRGRRRCSPGGSGSPIWSASAENCGTSFKRENRVACGLQQRRFEMATTAIDQGRFEALMGKALTDIGGTMSLLLAYMGDRLGLYRALE